MRCAGARSRADGEPASRTGWMRAAAGPMRATAACRTDRGPPHLQRASGGTCERLAGRDLSGVERAGGASGGLCARCRARAPDHALRRRCRHAQRAAHHRGGRRGAARGGMAGRRARRPPDAEQWRRQLRQHALADPGLSFSAADADHHARRVGRVQSVAAAHGPADRPHARALRHDRASSRRGGARRGYRARRRRDGVRGSDAGRRADRTGRDRRQGLWTLGHGHDAQRAFSPAAPRGRPSPSRRSWRHAGGRRARQHRLGHHRGRGPSAQSPALGCHGRCCLDRPRSGAGAAGAAGAGDHGRRRHADGPGLARDDRRTATGQPRDRGVRQRALRRDRYAADAHGARRRSRRDGAGRGHPFDRHRA